MSQPLAKTPPAYNSSVLCPGDPIPLLVVLFSIADTRQALSFQVFVHRLHALLDGFTHLHLQFTVLVIDRARSFSQDMELAELMRNAGVMGGNCIRSLESSRPPLALPC